MVIMKKLIKLYLVLLALLILTFAFGYLTSEIDPLPILLYLHMSFAALSFSLGVISSLLGSRSGLSLVSIASKFVGGGISLSATCGLVYLLKGISLMVILMLTGFLIALISVSFTIGYIVGVKKVIN